MSDHEQVYKDMVGVMGQRGMAFAGLDIPEFYPLMAGLFTPGEAAINNAMPAKTFTAGEMAEIMGADEPQMLATLKNMAERGLVFAFEKEGTPLFRAAPLVPGILEFIFYRGSATEHDKKMARLVKAYKVAYEAASPMKMPYPFQRVITVNEKVEEGNKIHTYDQVRTYIDDATRIAVGKCYCRFAAQLRDEDLHGMPLDTCMFMNRNAEFGIDSLGAKEISKEEALKLLDDCEEAGLIHMTTNVSGSTDFMCNCDKWHCFAVKIALKQDNPAEMFNSGFEPRFDSDACTACETCIDRCPPIALTMGEDDVPKVDLNLCFGCAVCATGCPSDAIQMVTKPGFETPPEDEKELMERMFAAFAEKQG